MKLEITGGCQCGAVRYSTTERPKPEFCHCRMCQRATGGVFAALGSVPKASLRWTRGEPSYFESSTVAKRGFCPQCGTPLTFAYNLSEHMDVTLGSLDDPEQVGPDLVQFAVESRLSWVHVNESAREQRLDEAKDSPVHQPGYQSFQAPAGDGE